MKLSAKRTYRTKGDLIAEVYEISNNSAIGAVLTPIEGFIAVWKVCRWSAETGRCISHAEHPEPEIFDICSEYI